ncbi:hypothetical protein JXJ21_06345, partial [candidate division KSB1 bacterium]|nr:hypothetical protein [candidate division KSB1 bacterium]
MQGFVYSFREGISGLRRAKLSCLLSIITITISLFLIGGILVIALNMHQILSSIRARMELEVFLDNSISGEKIRALQQQIASIEGVEKTEFISKEQAAEYFLSEFKQDITEILDANPLPASFRIKFSQSHQTAEGADSILNSIEGLPGID